MLRQYTEDSFGVQTSVTYTVLTNYMLLTNMFTLVHFSFKHIVRNEYNLHVYYHDQQLLALIKVEYASELGASTAAKSGCQTTVGDIYSYITTTVHRGIGSGRCVFGNVGPAVPPLAAERGKTIPVEFVATMKEEGGE
ncbi:unnamed protein product [Dicrocoelium dendriticum]|nr:unnamed protein product [Dicrocoelium dendriticum]